MRKITPKSWYGQFFFFAACEFICYFIIVANTRAFTAGSYKWTAITDMAFTSQQFALGVVMIDDKDSRTFWSGLGCVLGGCAGSLLSIWVTKHFYGA